MVRESSAAPLGIGDACAFQDWSHHGRSRVPDAWLSPPQAKVRNDSGFIGGCQRRGISAALRAGGWTGRALGYFVHAVVPVWVGYTEVLAPNDRVTQMIAFLGWGSLVWDPGALSIHRCWHTDGPYVRAEFLRQSKNGRLTLVLSEDAEPVRSLWATFSGSGLSEAREDLCTREGIPTKSLEKSIGSWSRGDANPAGISELDLWANARGIESVVWTALPPKFDGADGAGPTIDQAVSYLGGLTGPARDLAEQYIRRTPPQVDTAYRRRIEAVLGWSYARHHGVGG